MACQQRERERATEGERQAARAGGQVVARLRMAHEPLRRARRRLAHQPHDRCELLRLRVGRELAQRDEPALQPTGLREHAQHVERQHVRRPFPDRQHLRIAQQRRDAGVLDVARPAERLADFGKPGDHELAGEQLHDRRDQAQQRAGRVVAARMLAPAEQLDGEEHEVRGGLELGLQVGERLEVQRLVDERGAEHDAAGGIRSREREAAAQQRHGRNRVPHARDVQHRGDRAHAVARIGHELRGRAVEADLGGRQLARSELVLEAVHLDVAESAVAAARLDVEQCERVGAGPVAFRARERQRHVGHDCRGEPLAPVQAPAAVLVAARDRLGAADVRAARGLGHPLPRGPELGRVARHEVRHRALDQALVARIEQRARGTVGHRERARVELARRREEVHERELVQAGVRAELRLVAGRDESVARSDRGRRAPERAQLDAVDAVAPRVERHQPRFLAQCAHLRRPPVLRGRFAELVEAGLDGGERVGRKRAAQQGAQHAIGAVLVVELGRRLREAHVLLRFQRPPRRAASAAGSGATIRTRTSATSSSASARAGGSDHASATPWQK